MIYISEAEKNKIKLVKSYNLSAFIWEKVLNLG